MRTQLFQFRRFPAERAQRLIYSPAWGARSLFSVAGGGISLLASASYWSIQSETATALLLVGLGLLLFGAVAACVWVWRLLRGPQRPWGRLIVFGLLASWALDAVAQQQHADGWAAGLSALQWALLIGFVWRLLTYARGRRATQDEAARWAAGAVGETIVTNALAQLGADHVVINNLPLAGRGDADHVVVGPAGVVVIETKYLAGRISCVGEGIWMQAKHDEVRQIADPVAQVQRAAAAVDDRLKRRGLWNVPVHALLVLAHPRAEFETERSSVPVVRPFELVPLLRRLAREQARLEGSLIADTANCLLGAHPSLVRTVDVGTYARA